MEWARIGNQSQFEHGLELDEPQLGFWWWCVGRCIHMEYLSPVNCRVCIYMAPSTPQSLSCSIHSRLLFTAVLSQTPTTIRSFSPASSARDDRSFRSPFAISTSPQFTNSPKIRSLSHGWPTSPWVVLSSRYVLGRIPSGNPNSRPSSACFRCLFERRFVFFLGSSGPTSAHRE